MDMSSMSMGTSLFQDENMGLARTYWYLIIGVLGLLSIVRGANYISRVIRLRKCTSSPMQSPSKPTGPISQAWATATAIGRDFSYPQLYVPTRFLTWLTPPSLGRVLVLLVYWAVVIYMATAGAIIKDAYFWERIGFRNAWVTLTQLPILYLLASKSSVLGRIVGSSYERLNWLHRWVARTMFVTASIHGWHFWTEWVRADIVQEELELMSYMVYYGLAAWGLLLWANLSGLAPLRHMCYEFFIAQHMLTWVLLLWVIYVHVPSYAQYNVWFAIAALCFDRFYRSVLLVWQNINLRPNISKCKGGQRLGHKAQIRAVGEDTTVVTIKDVHFSWHAGQHLYLWMPQIGLSDHHPYTIASAHSLPETCICNSIQLIVRKHKGFSRRLHNHAKKNQSSNRNATVTAFVTGPYGLPPRWDVYETLVLISASTGASFTLPILESVLMAEQRSLCTRRIDFLLAAKKGDEIDYYVQRLHEMIDKAAAVGVQLKVHIAVTQGPPLPVLVNHSQSEKVASGASSSSDLGGANSSSGTTKVGAAAIDVEKMAMDVEKHALIRRESSGSNVHHLSTRPNIESFIREPVEAAAGETSVVVCGGKSLVARARNCVAKLSDERAVHKGTGAQGIHLHVEEYCF
ncbi:ferric-chelate reductase Frp1 [Gnomoniopsis sp. IMI 355080]|nr:ferric-chelate reductase Frp1 [Gnomoniopsis sp. IMI 355080]